MLPKTTEINPQKIDQDLKFHQSGENWPNLVTLFVRKCDPRIYDSASCDADWILRRR